VRGDLLAFRGETTPAARRWRAVARGRKPMVSVVRSGQRYILGM
jgi:hypothetical protein